MHRFNNNFAKFSGLYLWPNPLAAASSHCSLQLTEMKRVFLAPLVKVKQAISRIRQEAMQIDIRVGLLQHIILRQTLDTKLQLLDSVECDYTASSS